MAQLHSQWEKTAALIVKYHSRDAITLPNLRNKILEARRWDWEVKQVPPHVLGHPTCLYRRLPRMESKSAGTCANALFASRIFQLGFEPTASNVCGRWFGAVHLQYVSFAWVAPQRFLNVISPDW
jgi:hypothetical protein